MVTDGVTAPAYLIRKSGAWYRPNSAGYTTNIAEAGRYTLAEAEAITHPNGPDGPRDNMSYELSPALSPPIKAGEAVPVANLVKLPRICIPDPDNPGARIVGFRIREGDEAWGELGLSEPLFWLDRLASPQPEAYGVRVTDEMVDAAMRAGVDAGMVTGKRLRGINHSFSDDYGAMAIAQDAAKAAAKAIIALSHTEQGEPTP